jgi:hypothetical protein
MGPVSQDMAHPQAGEEQWQRMYSISGRGQPTRDGPLAWRLSESLTHSLPATLLACIPKQPFLTVY